MKLRTGYLISGIITGIFMLISFIWTLPDGRLHIVFCNVGQGDAAYIRFADGRDMLIDGGPNNSVLACLGRHMPFWDKHIDIVALTHPQNDHLGGLVSVFERYSVGYFIRSNVDNSSEGFAKLIKLAKDKGIPQKYMLAGDKITIDDTSLSVLWPSDTQVAKAHPEMAGVGINVLGTTTGDLNDYSVVLALRYGTFDVVFPGDADARVQAGFEQLQAYTYPVEVLKLPHHGSRTSVTREYMEALKPQITVISVGKNSFGHPVKETVDMLQSIGSTVIRTDQVGDIEVVSDGTNWNLIR